MYSVSSASETFDFHSQLSKRSSREFFFGSTLKTESLNALWHNYIWVCELISVNEILFLRLKTKAREKEGKTCIFARTYFPTNTIMLDVIVRHAWPEMEDKP